MAQFDANGLYVQGSVGASRLETKEDGVKFKGTDVGYSVAVGKDMGAVRYQVDYSSFGKLDKRLSEGEAGTVGYDEWTLTAKAQSSLGVSAIYDFTTNSKLTPYIGGRLGVNQLKTISDGNSLTILNGSLVSISYNESLKKTKVGAGAVAGVQYAINPQLTLDVNVEYNYLGKVDGMKFNQYGAKAGLRYNF